VPDPQDESENCPEAERNEEKETRLRNTDEGNQNKAKHNKQSNKMPSPLTSANWTERHNVWV